MSNKFSDGFKENIIYGAALESLDFEQISHIALVLPFLTLNKEILAR